MNMDILWGRRIKAYITFYNIAGIIMEAGHLVFSENSC